MSGDMAEKTLFEKIIDGEIPGEFIHQDEHCVAIRDIHPQAPTHFLVIPRKPIPNLAAIGPEDQALTGHLLLVARIVAAREGLADGFRVVINTGPQGGEEVPHLHLHVLGGRQMKWPPG